MRQLRRAADAAAAGGQHSASTQPLLCLAKLGGLLIEKRAVSIDDAREHLDAVADLGNVSNVVELRDIQDRKVA